MSDTTPRQPRGDGRRERPRRVGHFQEGVPMVCIKSASVGYREGRVYTPYRNERGHLVMKGEDGFEDLVVMLVSEFRPQK